MGVGIDVGVALTFEAELLHAVSAMLTAKIKIKYRRICIK